MHNGEMAGSAIVMNCDSIEQCWDWIHKDPYFQEGVWNKDDIEVQEWKLVKA